MGGTGFIGLGGWEFVILIVVFLVIVGPQRLPDVTRQLVQWVRQARRWVDDSRATVEDEMGIAMEDLKKYGTLASTTPVASSGRPGATPISRSCCPARSRSPSQPGRCSGRRPPSKAKSSKSGKSSKGSKDDSPQRAPFDPEAT